MTGRTVSHYQFQDLLGKGGMGEVYKARDTRLNRLVAIKVLRSDVMSSEMRRQRFVQEAQAASALNHPNIVTVHDIFQEEGSDFLVMEYVAGKTLDALIPRNGIRMNEVLRIGVQIAEGLRKAHAAGIVHRDIKPSNIIVADDGPVKILDFGLAKLLEGNASSDDATTRTVRPETEDGVVMGTVAYMSPEQAEGEKVDARTDIFSFGALLYEMLTGRRAFGGSSKLSTISAILREEPRPLEGIPADLEKILKRCLRKDRERRYQHMGDLKLALEEIQEDSASGRLEGSPRQLAARPWRMYAVLATAVLAAAGGLYFWRGRMNDPAAPKYRLRQLTADSGLSTTPAISPDGRMIAYASDRQTGGNLDIWVQLLAANARPIRLTTDDADDMSPSFSPDGASIVFYSRREGGGIYVIPALGGEARAVVKGKLTPACRPRFSPDGQWIAYSFGFLSDARVMVVPSAGGAPRVAGPQLFGASQPVWSPDSRWLATRAFTEHDENGEYWLAPVDGGAPRNTGIAASSQPQDWVGDSLIYADPKTVWAASIDSQTGRAGTPRQLLESTAGLSELQVNGQHGSDPRRIVFAGETVAAHLWEAPIDSNTGAPRGERKALPHSGGQQAYPTMSPDGRYLAYVQTDPVRSELRLREFATGKETVLGPGPARARFSPDGSRILIRGPLGVQILDRGTGEMEFLRDTRSTFNEDIYAWHRAGILYWHGRPTQFSFLDPSTKQLHSLISHPVRAIHGAELSPDGQWVAFHTPGQTREPIYIAPVREGRAAGDSEWVVICDSPGRNRRPWWSEDGNLLYFMADMDGPTSIWAQRLDAGKHPKGQPNPVVRFPEARRLPEITSAGFGPGTSTNRIVFSLRDRSANIWLAEASQ